MAVPCRFGGGAYFSAYKLHTHERNNTEEQPHEFNLKGTYVVSLKKKINGFGTLRYLTSEKNGIPNHHVSFALQIKKKMNMNKSLVLILGYLIC